MKIQMTNRMNFIRNMAGLKTTGFDISDASDGDTQFPINLSYQDGG
jgi:hypothetical protein